MKIRKSFIIIMTLVVVLGVGCIDQIVRTDWLTNIPFEQGVVQLFLGQEKISLGGTYPYGSLSVNLSSPEELKNVKLITSDVQVRFFKKSNVIKEMKIFLHYFKVAKNNKITAYISQYDKYITPAVDKKYSLNWDEFMEYAKKSDKIECSILLKFEANGQLYLIQKKGNLKKDVKRDISFGMYE